MGNEPLVSVIIPTYNREKQIVPTLESVLAQSYENKEIIIVDDGSEDNTKQVLSPYADKIIFIEKKNGGCSDARNFGISKAQGEYLAFLDSDDLWHPEKLKKQIDALMKKTDYGMAICDVEVLSDDQKKASEFSKFRKIIKNDGDILEYILQVPMMTCSYMVVKKEVFDDVGAFDVTFKTANDLDMMLRICNKYKTVLVESPLVKYKKTDNSVSHQLFTGSRIKALKKMEKYAEDFIAQHKKLICSTYARIHLSYGEDLLWNRNTLEARSQLTESIKNKFSFKALFLYLKSYFM